MEFLLINHPLDCPICDQGGGMPAAGPGRRLLERRNSRYDEPKRVVFNKNLGPLISTDMTRCIHCTRCVRFGQEIAGIMELGMANRGEHSEIMTFVGRTVDSELSGNVIDLWPGRRSLHRNRFRYNGPDVGACPVASRSRRTTVSVRISWCRSKNDRVNARSCRREKRKRQRVLACPTRTASPTKGLNSEDRLLQPMQRHDGETGRVRTGSERWKHVASELQRIRQRSRSGLDRIAGLAALHARGAVSLAPRKLMRGLGSENIDFRLRQSDFAAGRRRLDADALGWAMSNRGILPPSIACLVIGSFLRKDHPFVNAAPAPVDQERCPTLAAGILADDRTAAQAHTHKSIVAPSAMPRVAGGKSWSPRRNGGWRGGASGVVSGIEPSVEAKGHRGESRKWPAQGGLSRQFSRQQHPKRVAVATRWRSRFAEFDGCSPGVPDRSGPTQVGGYVANALPGKGGAHRAGACWPPRVRA